MAIKFLSTVAVDTNVLYVDAAANKVGIGTTSPTEKLHVAGNARVTGAYYDSGNTPGTANQLLASTATGTAWIDPSTIVAEAATLVVIACKNTSGATIAQGTPVYQTGTVGATATIEIAPADALISANKLPAIGLLQTALNNNGFGNVVITGELTNFTTDPIDGLTPTVGDKVFVKSGGGLTLTKPTGEGNGIQNMGLVGKVSGGNSGSITVSSIMRTNDVPNLPEGRIWVGDGNTEVSQTVYIDEPNNRLGIGTTSPSAKLHVYNTGNSEIEVERASGALVNIQAQSAKGLIGTDSNHTFSLKTNSSERLTILNSGNVGIGTTSPARELEVTGAGNVYIRVTAPTSTDSSAIELVNTAETWTIRNQDTNDNALEFLSDGGTKVTMVRTGDVGIGTTSPSSPLHIEFNSSSTTFPAGAGDYLQVENANTTINTHSSIALRSGTADSFISTVYKGVNIGDLVFNLDNGGVAEKMRILANGNVGIGTTSPQSILNINGGTGSLSTGLTFGDGDTGIWEASDDNLRFSTTSTTRMVINSSGDVGIGVTTPRAKLDVAGGVKVADDTDTAGANKVGTLRYRYVPGSPKNYSYVDMCMQTGASSYAWVNIVQNVW